MIELIIGTYGFTCWLVFKKLKLIKVIILLDGMYLMFNKDRNITIQNN